MKNKIKLITATMLLATTIIGCDKGYDCSLNNTAYNKIGFYTKTDGNSNAYDHPGPLDISLMVHGKDSLVINQLTNAGDILLPISYAQDTDTIIFHYEDGMKDSIFVGHTNTPIYQSMECGTIMHHKIETLQNTNVWIDSVAITNNIVNFDGNENIKIYFYK